MSSRLRLTAVSALLLIAGLLTWGAYAWLWTVEADRFEMAIENRDFRKARKIWNRGILRRPNRAYAEFMHLIDRLEARDGFEVKGFVITKHSPLNGTNRYMGFLGIEESADGDANEFSAWLEWDGSKWVLKADNPLIPLEFRNRLDYVRQALERDPSSEPKRGGE